MFLPGVVGHTDLPPVPALRLRQDPWFQDSFAFILGSQIKFKQQLGVMAHAFNPRKQRQEVEANLADKASSRPTRAIYIPVSKNKNK